MLGAGWNWGKTMGSREKKERRERLLKRSKELYVQELRKQIGELDGWLTQFAEVNSRETAQHLYHLAHKMKGSAPIFGLERAGKLAERLQDLWEWSLRSEGAVSPAEQLLAESQVLLLELKKEYGLRVKELEVDGQEGASRPAGPEGRLLLIDDDDLLRRYLVAQFQDLKYEVDEAPDVESAKRLLRQTAYDLILLDLMMYPQSGYELFEFLKEDPTLKWVPLVVLSGREDLEDKVRCLRLGADDYVTKPFQFAELEARVHTLLRRSKQFEQMAFRDALTGLYNRRYFDHQVQVMLQWVKRDRRPISLAFLDIDGFKSINDTYGHDVGDQVLQALGQLLQKNLRSTDLLARYGGEELVMVFPDTDEEQAVFVMKRILERVRTHPLARVKGKSLCVTFSAGVAEWEEGLTVQQWMRRADGAMYLAKQSGRNQVRTPEESVAVAAGDAAAVLPKQKLLIADDDELVCELIAEHLSKLPLEIERAHDGGETLAKLQRVHYDLVILDLMMPKMDGFDLLEAIRSDVRLRRVKVLVLSSRRGEADVVRGLQLGAVDYMAKPFSMLELELRVRKLLGVEERG
jgi:two-component system cell cycle response regulator